MYEAKCQNGMMNTGEDGPRRKGLFDHLIITFLDSCSGITFSILIATLALGKLIFGQSFSSIFHQWPYMSPSTFTCCPCTLYGSVCVGFVNQ